MTFLIADTFTDSLARLTGDEQKAVKTTAFDLQMNPSAPGLSFHKLEKAKDKRFWSVRVNAHVRLIVHRTDASLLLCYVDHHDRAYAWAERRKLETHPTTGAAQIIELRESFREVVVPTYVHAPAQAKAPNKPLAGVSDDTLLGYGVPAEWLGDIRGADEDGLLALVGHLPAEAAEAVLELATGGTPQVVKPEPSVPGVPPDPFTHPDAQRRFRVVASIEELERALDAPWEKWAVFLHPEQRQLVTKDYKGPARVAGSAGTGKTVVALHRAVHLARTIPNGRILLATFSRSVANQNRRIQRPIEASIKKPKAGAKAKPRASEAKPIKVREGEKVPVLLSGGNPQIAKADGDAPVQAYIAAMPGWKSEAGRRLDALIVRTVPGVRNPEVVEEWKWMGSPVWSHEGMYVLANAHKDKVAAWRLGSIGGFCRPQGAAPRMPAD